MCGISGCSLSGEAPQEIEALSNKLIQSLHHRGPDGNGSWSDYQNMLLCHNRLAIQDLTEAGKQPMMSLSKRFIISFNGEIYNFLDLKKDLVARGYIFKGHSDTEVILGAFDEWGIIDSLCRFNGMFAIAVWDTEEKELCLARDRLGEKPLYYGWLPTRFAFASELKALKTISPALNLNRSIIADFLSIGYIPTPFSVYDNIYKLTPGTLITFSVEQLRNRPDGYDAEPESNKISPKRYWSVYSLFEKQDDLIANPQEAIDLLEDKLLHAVQRQLVADVPVGAFLSGGIDSSTVVALMQHIASIPIKTYTIGFNVEQFDEAVFAKQIAKHLGTDHTEVYLDPNECLSIIDRLPTIYDEPFADPSQLPATLVCEIAKQHVTVCLSGDGGDELFAGYNRYLSAASILKKTAYLPSSLKKMIAQAFLLINAEIVDTTFNKLRCFLLGTRSKQASIGLKLHKLAKLLRTEDMGQLYSYLLSLSEFGRQEKSKSKLIVEDRVQKYFKIDRDFIDLAMLIDQLNYLPDDNLSKVDRAAMSCALETRLPILDKDVIELSWKIPSHMKTKNGKTKWPLREVLYKYVPQELIDRPKMGFSVPVSAWLRNELKDWSYDLIDQLRELSFADGDYWRALWNEHQSGRKDNGLALWPALMLSLWLRSNHNC